MMFSQCTGCSAALVAAASFPGFRVLKGHLPESREKNILSSLIFDSKLLPSLIAQCWPAEERGSHRCAQKQQKKGGNVLQLASK